MDRTSVRSDLELDQRSRNVLLNKPSTQGEKNMKPITYKTGTIPVVKLISKDNVCYVGEYIDMRIERDSVPKN